MHQTLNILVFAYVYPPDAGSGTYRTLHCSNNWAHRGDGVTVITVRESDFHPEALVDRALCQQINPGIVVVRTAAPHRIEELLKLRNRLRGSRATDSTPPVSSAFSPGSDRKRISLSSRIKDAFTGLLTFPDQHNGWIRPAVRAARALARKQHIDCIYATGGPWSALLAATWLHRRTGIPLVLDFRDPWASSPNLAARSRFVRAGNRLLEAFCVRGAARIITNTAELRQDFL